MVSSEEQLWRHGGCLIGSILLLADAHRRCMQCMRRPSHVACQSVRRSSEESGIVCRQDGNFNSISDWIYW